MMGMIKNFAASDFETQKLFRLNLLSDALNVNSLDDDGGESKHNDDTLGMLVSMVSWILIVMRMMSKIIMTLIPWDCWSVWCCGY